MKILRSSLVYLLNGFYSIPILFTRSSTTVHLSLFFPKNFGGHTLYIHPLLIHTSAWPSVPFHCLVILVSAFEFLVV